MANGLGRGLNSLIPQKLNNQPASSAEENDRVIEVHPDRIITNPLQPRQHFNSHKMDELVNSIREHGIVQPLIVTRKGNKYELIAGERRLRAAQMLKLDKVPVIVREADEQDKLEVALIENIQREDLNPLEMARAFRRLIDEFNLTQDDLAKKIGKSRSAVANTLRLLNLPPQIKSAIEKGKITEGHAKILAGMEDEAKQLTLFNRIVNTGMPVAHTIQEARRLGGTKEAKIKINYIDKDKEFALREFFKTRVEIKRKRKGGEIIIYFSSDEELGEIISKIKQ